MFRSLGLNRESFSWDGVRDRIVKSYMILLPSLLIFTSLGERTYQDVIFVALLLYGVLRKKYCSSKFIWALWGSWVFYALWSLLTDYLGAGSYDGGWFIRVELMLVFPLFLSWANRSQFAAWLFQGFRLALIIGLPVALWQVFYQGMSRAQGAENALVFAACISIYGLFVIHETIVRRERNAAVWVATTITILVLSGSTGVVISSLCGLFCLLFLVPLRQALMSLVLPIALVALVFGIGFAEGDLVRILKVYQHKGAFSEISVDQVIKDFVNQDFVVKGNQAQKWLKKGKRPPLREEYRNSVGYRLVYLRGGWEVFREHPFIGVGSRDDTLQVGQVLGLGSRLARLSHVHNAFLQDLVAGGVVKLMSLLTVIVLPVVALYRKKYASGFSLLLVISINYIVFGMTNMLFQLTTLNIINTLILVYIFSHLSQLDGRASSV